MKITKAAFFNTSSSPPGPFSCWGQSSCPSQIFSQAIQVCPSSQVNSSNRHTAPPWKCQHQMELQSGEISTNRELSWKDVFLLQGRVWELDGWVRIGRRGEGRTPHRTRDVLLQWKRRWHIVPFTSSLEVFVMYLYPVPHLEQGLGWESGKSFKCQPAGQCPGWQAGRWCRTHRRGWRCWTATLCNTFTFP